MKMNLGICVSVESERGHQEESLRVGGRVIGSLVDLKEGDIVNE